MADKPLPIPDSETEPFWTAACGGKLCIQKCTSCSEYIFYPRLVCPACMSDALEWVESSGKGEIYSFTVVHKAQGPFREEAPYAVALVELEEGVRMMTRIETENPKGLRIGQPVSVVFREASEEITLPYFSVAD